MGLVDEEDEVVREVVDQRVRRASGRPAVEDPRVVLDPRAEAELAHHLHVVAGALLEPVRLELLAVLLEVGDLVAELALDLVDRALHRLLLDDVVARRPDRDVVDHVEDLAGERIEVLDRLDLVPEELDPVGGLGVGGIDLEHLAAGAEGAAGQVLVVAPVLHADQLAEDVLAVDPVPDLEQLHLLPVELRGADPVDAGDRGDDDHVVAGEQRGGRRVPQAVDLVVDRGVLLDVEILRRDVGLGLVVVVVGDEVLDGVVREELPELVAELRRQRLVVGDHQRRPLHALDRRGHREGLAGPGRAQQGLEPLLGAEPLGEALDRLRLVRRRRVGRIELELRHAPQRTQGPCSTRPPRSPRSVAPSARTSISTISSRSGAPSSSQVSIAASTYDVHARSPTRTAGRSGIEAHRLGEPVDTPPSRPLQRLADLAEAGRPGHQVAIARRMLADRVGEVPKARAEPVDRRQLRIRLDTRAEALDQGLEAGDVEALLAAEVLEDQPVGYAGGLRDLIDRDLLVVPVAEHLERGGQQLRASFLGSVSCQRASWDGSA